MMTDDNKLKSMADTWLLKLYIAGETDRSREALSNLQKYCEDHLEGMYKIEVIDLNKNPEKAKQDDILAIPTVVRKVPEPVRKIIGDLSDKEKVLVGLNLKPWA
jgi:circadian clock protein KaiB